MKTITIREDALLEILTTHIQRGIERRKWESVFIRAEKAKQAIIEASAEAESRRKQICKILNDDEI